MFFFKTERGQIEKLKAKLTTQKQLNRELGAAVNQTVKKGKSLISKEIRAELATTAKAVNSLISVDRAKGSETEGHVRLKKTKRIPLREFGARATKKGVSYKTSKTKGRKTIPGAFIPSEPGPIRDKKTGRFIKRVRQVKLGGHVFKRAGKGRLPIIKLNGVSPWGVYTKNNIDKPLRKELKREFVKQIDRRLRLLELRKKGVVK